MSYMALYRKWRPDEFEDVKGQENIVTTLKNQINADRVGHAYLFCGTRGTGKTTIAKLFAKAVNCENPKDGSPGGECESCKAIKAGNSMNVIEIDAASNNGVDNIREIREEVAYRPTQGKYKVYIIDEVHMLSIGAFNALLKTLEEPPSYVIFILATTEVNKIPITILSRCQRYDFKRISVETIADRLRELMTAEQIDVEDKALMYIAKTADGSLRDALSLLEQCISFNYGKTLTYEAALDVLGAVDASVFADMLKYILAQDTAKAISLLDDVIMQGREISQFVNDFTWYLRNILLIKNAGDNTDIVDMSKENLLVLMEMGKSISDNTLMRYIRILSELSGQIKFAMQKRILVEIAIIKMIKPPMEENLEALINRVENLERQLEEGVVLKSKDASYADREDNIREEQVKKIDINDIPQASREDILKVADKWADIISTFAMPTSRFLKASKTALGDNGNIILNFSDEMGYNYCNKESVINELKGYIAAKCGVSVEIQMKLNTDKTQRTEDLFTNLKECVKMDITVDDDDKEDFF